MAQHIACRDLLRSWIARRLAPESLAWLDDVSHQVSEGGPDRDLYTAVSLVPRRLGKGDLGLTADDAAEAEALRPGWYPGDWSVDQAGRVVLVLSVADAARMAEIVEQLCITADVAELVAFYRGLPLYPDAARYLGRAREGARTNMKAVFNAVAHNNPYPMENFDEAAWNQMILKALFIGSPLWPIQGLDERANPALARMLCDYAHERWSAGRHVSPELWRCVGRFANEAMLADLERVIEGGTDEERLAAALALAESGEPAAKEILARAGDLSGRVSDGRLSWNDMRAD